MVFLASSSQRIAVSNKSWHSILIPGWELGTLSLPTVAGGDATDLVFAARKVDASETQKIFACVQHRAQGRKLHENLLEFPGMCCCRYSKQSVPCGMLYCAAVV
jgi:hypothetical protein